MIYLKSENESDIVNINNLYKYIIIFQYYLIKKPLLISLGCLINYFSSIIQKFHFLAKYLLKMSKLTCLPAYSLIFFNLSFSS
jgi:hypothetical protein